MALGVEVRLLWGDSLVGEYFVAPGEERHFTVGTGPGVTFAMGDEAWGGGSFEAVTIDARGARVHVARGMRGSVFRGLEAQPQSLDGVTGSEGVSSISLGRHDSARVDLGGVQLEVCHQVAPRRVTTPLWHELDYTSLNLFLALSCAAIMFSLAASFRGDDDVSWADDLTTQQAAMVHLLVRAAPPPLVPAPSPREPARVAGTAAPGPQGRVGAKSKPPPQATRATPMAGTVTAQVRLALQSLGAVGAQSPAGLRGLLSSALSEVHAPSVGDATGFGGLGLHGRDNGGGGETIGLQGLATRGRATGDSTYGRISNGLNPRRAPVAVVIDDTPPEVIGGLDMELIREVIHRQRAQIRYCYESQLGRAPTLQGKVLLKFVIGAGGQVVESAIAHSSLGHAAVEACVASRARLWAFPPPRGGGRVVVTYPFVFRQSGQ